MLKDLKRNKKGVIFVTVLMIIIVSMILAISIISMNITQVMVAESETKRIQAEIVAFGALAYTFADQDTASPSDTITYSTNIDGQNFDTSIAVGDPGTGINNTGLLSINVTY